VVFEATGTLNLTGLIKITSGTSLAAVIPSVALVNLGAGPGMSQGVDVYSGLSFAPSNFGPGGASLPALGSGPRFAVSSNDLRVPVGFAGGAISASSTYEGTTLAALGAEPGTYLWDWGVDSVTLQIVPEPAAALLLWTAAFVACGRSRARSQPGTVSRGWGSRIWT
jgi:hypothetical protein